MPKICEYCGKPIRNDMIIKFDGIADRYYHDSCYYKMLKEKGKKELICNYCKKPISNNEYYIHTHIPELSVIVNKYYHYSCYKMFKNVEG